MANNQTTGFSAFEPGQSRIELASAGVGEERGTRKANHSASGHRCALSRPSTHCCPTQPLPVAQTQLAPAEALPWDQHGCPSQVSAGWQVLSLPGARRDTATEERLAGDVLRSAKSFIFCCSIPPLLPFPTSFPPSLVLSLLVYFIKV